jgi:hypothetical protein
LFCFAVVEKLKGATPTTNLVMNISPRFTVHKVYDDNGGSFAEIAVVTDTLPVKILALNNATEMLQLFDTRDWSCVDRIKLEFPAAGLAVHGDRVLVTRMFQNEVHEILMSPRLTLRNVFHVREDGYKHITYMDNDRLVAVSPFGPAVHVLSHTCDLLLDLTTQHSFLTPRHAACCANDIIIGDRGLALARGEIVPSVVCLTLTGTICAVKWVHQLQSGQRPADLLVYEDTILFYLPTSKSIIQIGIDHGDKLAVLPLPSGCPALFGTLCLYGDVIHGGSY